MSTNKHALVLGVTMCALAAGAAQAQSSGAAQAPESLEEITVTSFAASLHTALETKKDAMAVVDSIAAEDLGKFPSANIAEALQRIPGVAIDRNAGQGRYVTIRGLGPAFNNVLLNGRHVTSEDGGREFSFDALPADLISGADVYKSGVAYIPAGGTGGTINLKTLRPLDLKDTIVLSAKGVDDTNRGKWKPQGLGLFSTQFMDGMFGVLGGVSYQKRAFNTSSADMTWATFTPAHQGEGGLLAPSATIINPANVTSGFYAQEFRQSVVVNDETRLTLQGALQFRPMKDLTFTLDGLYSDYKDQSEWSALNEYQNIDRLDFIQLNNEGTDIKHTQNLGGAGAYEQFVFPNLRHPKTKQFGLNADWQATDSLRVVADTSISRTTSPPQSNQGLAITGFRGRDELDQHGGGSPTTSIIYATDAQLTNPANQMLHVILQPGYGTLVKDRAWDSKLDVTWSPQVEGHPILRAGVNYVSSVKDSVGFGNFNTPSMFFGFLIPAAIPPSDFSVFPYAVPGGHHLIWTNPINYVNYSGSAAGLAARDKIYGLPPGTSAAQFAANGGWALQTNSSGYDVGENLLSGYLSGSFEGKLGVPYKVEFGGRYEQTKTSASGFALQLVEIDRGLDATSYLPIYATNTPQLISKENKYGSFLPNADLKLTMAENRFLPNDSLLLRLSWAKTLTRPELAQIAPSLNLNLPRPNFLNGTGGNVDLKPYRADNYDVGLEYYFGRINYVSAAVYRKKISDFITQSNVTQCFTIRNPDNINDTAVTGNQACYSILEPSNTTQARVNGFEFAVQTQFEFLPSPLDGLGVIGNLTNVSSNAAYNPAVLNQVFAIPGLSNTRNATVFYAKGPVEARVAYSWRAKFYEAPAGFGIEPRFVEPYSQVDAQISLDLAPWVHLGDFKLVLAGTNIGNSKLRKTGRFEDQFARLEWTGPSYAVELRARF